MNSYKVKYYELAKVEEATVEAYSFKVISAGSDVVVTFQLDGAGENTHVFSNVISIEKIDSNI